MYYEARYYDPVTGHFSSVDPLFVEIGQYPDENDKDNQELFHRLISTIDELNFYSYVNNNPLIFTDPTGLGKTSSVKKIIEISKKYSAQIMDNNPNKGKKRAKVIDNKGNSKNTKIYEDGTVKGDLKGKLPKSGIDKVVDALGEILLVVISFFDPFGVTDPADAE